MPSQPAAIRWILAFDASCCQCRTLAERVGQLGAHRLEIAPLARPDVVAWRTRALGEEPPHAPTLLRVDGDRVNAWTGLAMAIRLIGRLKVGGTLGLLSILGQSRRSGTDRHPLTTESRRQFLRLAGLGVAASVLLGRTPIAEAVARVPSPAQEWVAANRANLPGTYDDFIVHDELHRRAIFAALSPTTQRDLWMAHLTQYRATHPELTPEQRHALSMAEAVLGAEDTFVMPLDPATEQRLHKLTEVAIAAFGKEEAGRVIATIGPEAPGKATTAARSACSCSTSSDWCNTHYPYSWCSLLYDNCSRSYVGCGTGLVFPCDGDCTY